MKHRWVVLTFLLLLPACASFVRPPIPTLSPTEAHGKAVFQQFCSRCHSTSADVVIVGPSLAGIASRAGTRMEGVGADEYILDSIRNPTAYTVEGFPEGTMPEELDLEMSQEELEAVVAFLLTLE